MQPPERTYLVLVSCLAFSMVCLCIAFFKSTDLFKQLEFEILHVSYGQKKKKMNPVRRKKTNKTLSWLFSFRMFLEGCCTRTLAPVQNGPNWWPRDAEQSLMWKRPLRLCSETPLRVSPLTAGKVGLQLLTRGVDRTSLRWCHSRMWHTFASWMLLHFSSSECETHQGCS